MARAFTTVLDDQPAPISASMRVARVRRASDGLAPYRPLQRGGLTQRDQCRRADGAGGHLRRQPVLEGTRAVPEAVVAITTNCYDAGPLATAALVAQAIVMIWQVHLPEGFRNSRGGFPFPMTLGAIAVAIAAIGPGAVSLDHALGLVYPGDVRAAVLLLGAAGAIVALLLPRVAMPVSAAAEPR